MGSSEVHRVVTRDGVDLHTWSSGTSETAAILTHGVSMDHRMWMPQVEALSDLVRVIVHDVRGHGRSTCEPSEFTPQACADDLDAILDAYDISSAVLVGHSFGGTVCQLFALAQPERVRGLVGLGCACITLPPSGIMRAFSAVAPTIARRMGPEQMRTDTAKRAGLRPATRDYAMDAMAALDDRMFERSVSVGFGDYQDRPDYRLDRPLLLLQGRKDGYRYLLSSARRWADRDGGAYIFVPDAAHNAGQDNPDFVNARLREFMQRIVTA